MASRERQLHVRINDLEFKDIQRNAKKAGLNLSQYSRKVLIGDVVKEAKPIEYFQLYNEINKIGVNINQIAKIANTNQELEENQISQVQFLLTKIYNLLDESVN